MSGSFAGDILDDVRAYIADHHEMRFGSPYAYALWLLWNQLDSGFSLDDLKQLRGHLVELDISWDTLPERETAPPGVARCDLYAAYAGDADAAVAVAGHIRRTNPDWRQDSLSRAWMSVAAELKTRERNASSLAADRLRGSRVDSFTPRVVRGLLLRELESQEDAQ